VRARGHKRDTYKGNPDKLASRQGDLRSAMDTAISVALAKTVGPRINS
jgi:hypothetical protein